METLVRVESVYRNPEADGNVCPGYNGAAVRGRCLSQRRTGQSTTVAARGSPEAASQERHA